MSSSRRSRSGVEADAPPEALERRAAQVGREAAPQQLAVHLEVRAGHHRVDEELVHLHQHDQVLRQVVDAGHERVPVVVGEVAVERVAQVRPGHHAVEQLRDHEPVVGEATLAEEARDVRGWQPCRARAVRSTRWRRGAAARSAPGRCGRARRLPPARAGNRPPAPATRLPAKASRQVCCTPRVATVKRFSTSRLRIAGGSVMLTTGGSPPVGGLTSNSKLALSVKRPADAAGSRHQRVRRQGREQASRR